MVKVKVLRILNGGEYIPGDERELDKADAKRLASTGAVEIIEQSAPAAESEAKAEPGPENKMAAEPENKAVTMTPRKRGK